MKAKRWNIHFDHWWAEDVKRFGAPIRVYIRTPWIFIQAGEKSQVYDWKTKKYTDKWSFLTLRPLH